MLAPHPPTYRALCLRCRRAASACVCSVIPPLRTRSRLLFLQHPREARNPIGTARMAHLALQGSLLRADVEFAADPVVREFLAQPGRRTVVLYPGRDARDARELSAVEEDLNIVILDGTWWQARKLWRMNPALHALPAYRLDPAEPGRYRIRREPAAHCLSTIEAVAALLAVVERDGQDWPALLRPFDAMVEKQLEHARSPHPRHLGRTTPRVPRLRPAVPELAAALPHLLVVHGEGNGYSTRPSAGPHHAALLQWEAWRPGTGERFHAWVDAGVPLAPGALEQLRVDESVLRGRRSPAEFLAAWHAFVRPLDRWAAWGTFTPNLLRTLGAPVPVDVVDLHRHAAERLQKKVGPPETVAAPLGLPPVPPVTRGRGEARLHLLTAMAHALAAPGSALPRPPRKRAPRELRT
ncbi:MAG: DTW domain-containing protein [Deltaproteobacteria bacterium]|nr:DTW domain-containing protein [Deltaproteobacteria bacterium]